MSKDANQKYSQRVVEQTQARMFRRTLKTTLMLVPVLLAIGVLHIVADIDVMGVLPSAPPWVLPFALMGAMGGFVWWRTRGYLRGVALALQMPTSAALLAVHDRYLGRLDAPDADAIVTHARAVAHVLYGEGDQARACLQTIGWATRAPVIQAIELAAQSLVALICDQDPEVGLTAALRAQSMAAMPEAAPGVKETTRHYAFFVAFAEVLAEQTRPTSLAALADTLQGNTTPATHRALALVGLAVDAQHKGDEHAAASHRHTLRAIAPHLHALLFDTSGTDGVRVLK